MVSRSPTGGGRGAGRPLRPGFRGENAVLLGPLAISRGGCSEGRRVGIHAQQKSGWTARWLPAERWARVRVGIRALPPPSLPALPMGGVGVASGRRLRHGPGPGSLRRSEGSTGSPRSGRTRVNPRRGPCSRSRRSGYPSGGHAVNRAHSRWAAARAASASVRNDARTFVHWVGEPLQEGLTILTVQENVLVGVSSGGDVIHRLLDPECSSHRDSSHPV